jgi:hypothetical protein
MNLAPLLDYLAELVAEEVLAGPPVDACGASANDEEAPEGELQTRGLSSARERET